MDTPLTRRSIWIEVLTLYLGTALLIRLIKMTQEGLGLSQDWLVVVALVFLYSPAVVERWHGYRVSDDIQYPDPLRPALWKAFKFFAAIVLLIYPLFIAGNHVWQTWGFHWFTADVLDLRFPYRPHFPTHGLPDDLLVHAAYQLLCVGYAEEYFYRGYMQTRLDAIYDPKRFHFLGADFGWSLFITAILFTLGHSLVTLQWWQPFIFFPSLVFGWMRARTGNVLAGSMFHAWANAAMYTLDHIYGVTA